MWGSCRLGNVPKWVISMVQTGQMGWIDRNTFCPNSFSNSCEYYMLDMITENIDF